MKAEFDRMRKFGVEIEIEGLDRFDAAAALRAVGIQAWAENYNHDRRRFWKIVPDSSIRGHETCEVVSPPLAGEEGLEEVGKVMQALKAAGATVNVSCGFHVHWDASDLKAKELAKIVAVYAKFIPSIDMLVPPSRRANSYCRKWFLDDAQDMLEFCKAERTNNPARLSRWILNVKSRYYVVNLGSYLRHGTVEFRQFAGTLNPTKAKAWIVFTQMFVNKAKRPVRIQPAHHPEWLGELFSVLGMHRSEDPIVIEAREYLRQRSKKWRKAR